MFHQRLVIRPPVQVQTLGMPRHFQSKLLGAQNVSLVYRRGKEDMSASVYGQELATSKGVRIIYNATP